METTTRLLRRQQVEVLKRMPGGKPRHHNIKRRASRKQVSGQVDAPWRRWWAAPLTTITVAIVKALIEHWPWSR
jgi:hypothetical protein